uniref:Uncharacterized protein n=1 Tax=Anguilla anguilla TaxID=7936 RepID=A0A0E9Q694_ANGAN
MQTTHRKATTGFKPRTFLP